MSTIYNQVASSHVDHHCRQRDVLQRARHQHATDRMEFCRADEEEHATHRQVCVCVMLCYVLCERVCVCTYSFLSHTYTFTLIPALIHDSILWFGVDDTAATIWAPMYGGITQTPGAYGSGAMFGDVTKFDMTQMFWIQNMVWCSGVECI